MHKTGSTSIQAFMNNIENNNDLCYFKFGHQNHTERIVSLFSKERMCIAHQKKNWSAQQIERFNRETLELFKKNMASCHSGRMLISGEGIAGLSREELLELSEFLYTYFDRVKVIAYVRSPKGYLESYFQELVKLGLSNFTIENIFPKYKKIFEKFDFAFGKENVDLLPFENIRKDNPNILSDFCSRLGIKFDNNSIYTNESLSKEALSLLYIYRKYGPGYGTGPDVIKENNRLINELRKIGNSKMIFCDLFICRLIDKYKDEVFWIRDRMGDDNFAICEDENKHQDSCVETEKDILEVDPDAVKQLFTLANLYINDQDSLKDVDKIATAVHRLRLLLRKDSQMQSIKRVNFVDISKNIKTFNNDFVSLCDSEIAEIGTLVLREIVKILESQKDKILYISGVGKFVLQKTKPVHSIVFSPDEKFTINGALNKINQEASNE